MNKDIFDGLLEQIQASSASEGVAIEDMDKRALQKAIERIRNTKINVLLVGGTGVGKSLNRPEYFGDSLS